MYIFRRYDSPFLVDPSKLMKLMGVIRQRLDETALVRAEHFEMYLSSGRVIGCSSLEDILTIDNSKKNRLERLKCSCSTSRQDRRTAEHELEVEFDGQGRVPTVIISAMS